MQAGGGHARHGEARLGPLTSAERRLEGRPLRSAPPLVQTALLDQVKDWGDKGAQTKAA